MKDSLYGENYYRDYLYTGLIGVIFKWQHKLLSPKIYSNCEKVLEIGPGFEPHIKYKKLTNQILNSYEIKHISVLQPHVVFKNKLNENEKTFTRYDYRKRVVKDLYEYLNLSMLKIPLSKNYQYLDSRKIFNNNDKWIFSDDVHFINDEGYKILIDNIVQNIKD